MCTLDLLGGNGALTFASFPLVLNIMPHFPQNEALRTSYAEPPADSAFHIPGSVSALAALLLLQAKAARGPGDQVCPGARGRRRSDPVLENRRGPS